MSLSYTVWGYPATRLSLSLAFAAALLMAGSVATAQSEKRTVFTEGNFHWQGNLKPGQTLEVINRNGQIASWANYGSFVDVGAPGSSVVSFANQAYVVTGTSSSTAFASGIAAAASQATGKSGSSLSPLVMQSLAIPGRK